MIQHIRKAKNAIGQMDPETLCFKYKYHFDFSIKIMIT